MGSHDPPKVGSIGWVDLTVKNAEQVKNFYSKVVGWKTTDADMGEYSDYSMIIPESGEAVAGVCHARGANQEMPRQWLLYISVANLDKSIAQCEELGGKVIAPVRGAGAYGRFCVIQDPAGAVVALMEPKR